MWGYTSVIKELEKKSTSFEQLNLDFLSARDELRALQKEYHEIQQKYDEIQAECNQHEITLEEIQSEYNFIQEKYNILQLAYETLDSDSTQSISEHDRVHVQNENLEMKIRVLKSKVEEAQKKLINGDLENSETEISISELAQQHTWSENDRNHKNDAEPNEIDSYEENIRLRHALKIISMQYDKLQNEYDDLSTELVDHISDNEALEEEVRQLKLELEKLKYSESNSRWKTKDDALQEQLEDHHIENVQPETPPEEWEKQISSIDESENDKCQNERKSNFYLGTYKTSGRNSGIFDNSVLSKSLMEIAGPTTIEEVMKLSNIIRRLTEAQIVMIKVEPMVEGMSNKLQMFIEIPIRNGEVGLLNGIHVYEKPDKFRVSSIISDENYDSRVKTKLTDIITTTQGLNIHGFHQKIKNGYPQVKLGHTQYDLRKENHEKQILIDELSRSDCMVKMLGEANENLEKPISRSLIPISKPLTPPLEVNATFLELKELLKTMSQFLKYEMNCNCLELGSQLKSTLIEIKQILKDCDLRCQKTKTNPQFIQSECESKCQITASKKQLQETPIKKDKELVLEEPNSHLQCPTCSKLQIKLEDITLKYEKEVNNLRQKLNQQEFQNQEAQLELKARLQNKSEECNGQPTELEKLIGKQLHLHQIPQKQPKCSKTSENLQGTIKIVGCTIKTPANHLDTDKQVENMPEEEKDATKLELPLSELSQDLTEHLVHEKDLNNKSVQLHRDFQFSMDTKIDEFNVLEQPHKSVRAQNNFLRINIYVKNDEFDLLRKEYKSVKDLNLKVIVENEYFVVLQQYLRSSQNDVTFKPKHDECAILERLKSMQAENTSLRTFIKVRNEQFDLLGKEYELLNDQNLEPTLKNEELTNFKQQYRQCPDQHKSKHDECAILEAELKSFQVGDRSLQIIANVKNVQFDLLWKECELLNDQNLEPTLKNEELTNFKQQYRQCPDQHKSKHDECAILEAELKSFQVGDRSLQIIANVKNVQFDLLWKECELLNDQNLKPTLKNEELTNFKQGFRLFSDQHKSKHDECAILEAELKSLQAGNRSLQIIANAKNLQFDLLEKEYKLLKDQNLKPTLINEELTNFKQRFRLFSDQHKSKNDECAILETELKSVQAENSSLRTIANVKNGQNLEFVIKSEGLMKSDQQFRSPLDQNNNLKTVLKIKHDNFTTLETQLKSFQTGNNTLQISATARNEAFVGAEEHFNFGNVLNQEIDVENQAFAILAKPLKISKDQKSSVNYDEFAILEGQFKKLQVENNKLLANANIENENFDLLQEDSKLEMGLNNIVNNLETTLQHDQNNTREINPTDKNDRFILLKSDYELPELQKNTIQNSLNTKENALTLLTEKYKFAPTQNDISQRMAKSRELTVLEEEYKSHLNQNNRLERCFNAKRKNCLLLKEKFKLSDSVKISYPVRKDALGEKYIVPQGGVANETEQFTLTKKHEKQYDKSVIEDVDTKSWKYVILEKPLKSLQIRDKRSQISQNVNKHATSLLAGWDDKKKAINEDFGVEDQKYNTLKKQRMAKTYPTILFSEQYAEFKTINYNPKTNNPKYAISDESLQPRGNRILVGQNLKNDTICLFGGQPDKFKPKNQDVDIKNHEYATLEHHLKPLQAQNNIQGTKTYTIGLFERQCDNLQAANQDIYTKHQKCALLELSHEPLDAQNRKTDVCQNAKNHMSSLLEQQYHKIENKYLDNKSALNQLKSQNVSLQSLESLETLNLITDISQNTKKHIPSLFEEQYQQIEIQYHNTKFSLNPLHSQNVSLQMRENIQTHTDMWGGSIVPNVTVGFGGTATDILFEEQYYKSKAANKVLQTKLDVKQLLKPLQKASLQQISQNVENHTATLFDEQHGKSNVINDALGTEKKNAILEQPLELSHAQNYGSPIGQNVKNYTITLFEEQYDKSKALNQDLTVKSHKFTTLEEQFKLLQVQNNTLDTMENLETARISLFKKHCDKSKITNVDLQTRRQECALKQRFQMQQDKLENQNAKTQESILFGEQLNNSKTLNQDQKLKNQEWILKQSLETLDSLNECFQINQHPQNDQTLLFEEQYDNSEAVNQDQEFKHQKCALKLQFETLLQPSETVHPSRNSQNDCINLFEKEYNKSETVNQDKEFKRQKCALKQQFETLHPPNERLHPSRNSQNDCINLFEEQYDNSEAVNQDEEFKHQKCALKQQFETLHPPNKSLHPSRNSQNDCINLFEKEYNKSETLNQYQEFKHQKCALKQQFETLLPPNESLQLSQNAQNDCINLFEKEYNKSETVNQDQQFKHQKCALEQQFETLHPPNESLHPSQNAQNDCINLFEKQHDKSEAVNQDQQFKHQKCALKQQFETFHPPNESLHPSQNSQNDCINLFEEQYLYKNSEIMNQEVRPKNQKYAFKQTFKILPSPNKSIQISRNSQNGGNNLFEEQYDRSKTEYQDLEFKNQKCAPKLPLETLETHNESLQSSQNPKIEQTILFEEQYKERKTKSQNHQGALLKLVKEPRVQNCTSKVKPIITNEKLYTVKEEQDLLDDQSNALQTGTNDEQLNLLGKHQQRSKDKQLELLDGQFNLCQESKDTVSKTAKPVSHPKGDHAFKLDKMVIMNLLDPNKKHDEVENKYMNLKRETTSRLSSNYKKNNTLGSNKPPKSKDSLKNAIVTDLSHRDKLRLNCLQVTKPTQNTTQGFKKPLEKCLLGHKAKLKRELGFGSQTKSQKHQDSLLEKGHKQSIVHNTILQGNLNVENERCCTTKEDYELLEVENTEFQKQTEKEYCVKTRFRTSAHSQVGPGKTTVLQKKAYFQESTPSRENEMKAGDFKYTVFNLQNLYDLKQSPKGDDQRLCDCSKNLMNSQEKNQLQQGYPMDFVTNYMVEKSYKNPGGCEEEVVVPRNGLQQKGEKIRQWQKTFSQSQTNSYKLQNILTSEQKKCHLLSTYLEQQKSQNETTTHYLDTFKEEGMVHQLNHHDNASETDIDFKKSPTQRNFELNQFKQNRAKLIRDSSELQGDPEYEKQGLQSEKECPEMPTEVAYWKSQCDAQSKALDSTINHSKIDKNTGKKCKGSKNAAKNKLIRINREPDKPKYQKFQEEPYKKLTQKTSPVGFRLVEKPLSHAMQKQPVKENSPTTIHKTDNIILNCPSACLTSNEHKFGDIILQANTPQEHSNTSKRGLLPFNESLVQLIEYNTPTAAHIDVPMQGHKCVKEQCSVLRSRLHEKTQECIYYKTKFSTLYVDYIELQDHCTLIETILADEKCIDLEKTLMTQTVQYKSSQASITTFKKPLIENRLNNCICEKKVRESDLTQLHKSCASYKVKYKKVKENLLELQKHCDKIKKSLINGRREQVQLKKKSIEWEQKERILYERIAQQNETFEKSMNEKMSEILSLQQKLTLLLTENAQHIKQGTKAGYSECHKQKTKNSCLTEKLESCYKSREEDRRRHRIKAHDKRRIALS